MTAAAASERASERQAIRDEHKETVYLVLGFNDCTFNHIDHNMPDNVHSDI